MNPFKVPIRTEKQVDPRDIGIEKQMENLTIATKNEVRTIAPLQVMKQPIQAYTIVPQVGDITLPGVPNIDLPDIPGVGVEIKPEESGNIIRRYQAW